MVEHMQQPCSCTRAWVMFPLETSMDHALAQAMCTRIGGFLGKLISGFMELLNRSIVPHHAWVMFPLETSKIAQNVL